MAPVAEPLRAPIAPHESPVQLQHANFINRDLSLIEFFRRVLDEAFDKTQPLLERLKFISIFSSNLDEFFMIRVSGLKEKLGREIGVSPDGWTTPELLAEIRIIVTEMINSQMRCLRDEILLKLESSAPRGCRLVAWPALSRWRSPAAG